MGFSLWSLDSCMAIFKILYLAILIVKKWSSSAIATDRWEAWGIASTGEKVHLNLNSIQIDRCSLGFKAPPGYFSLTKLVTIGLKPLHPVMVGSRWESMGCSSL